MSQRRDERLGMGEASALGQAGRRLRLVAFNLRAVEDEKASGEHAASAAVVLGARLVVLGRAGLLPEHDGGGLLAFTDLGAGGLPLPVGAP